MERNYNIFFHAFATDGCSIFTASDGSLTDIIVSCAVCQRKLSHDKQSMRSVGGYEKEELGLLMQDSSGMV